VTFSLLWKAEDFRPLYWTREKINSTSAVWGYPRNHLKRVQIVLLLLILVPAIINFATPIYNFVDPTLGGLPFFYWFQILMLALSTLPYLAFTAIENRRSRASLSGRQGGS